MSFPTSPIDGQQSIINGIKYSYSTGTTAWTRLSTATVSVSGTADVFAITNTATATSPVTGALRVAGGAGIVGNLNVGGTISATNVLINGTPLLPTVIQNFTSGANSSTFVVSGGYVQGYVQVFVNGLLLPPSDYTASNGTSITLNEARNLNDAVTVISTPYGILSTPTPSNAFAIAMGVALGI